MCRTCKFFYAYGIPRLYQSVRVRLPFWTSEPGLNFGSYFDNGRIPFNLFISPPGGIIGAELGKYPKICELGEYVKHLELSGTWDVSARSHNFVGVPETIRHNLVVYDIWKAKLVSTPNLLARY